MKFCEGPGERCASGAFCSLKSSFFEREGWYALKLPSDVLPMRLCNMLWTDC